MSCDSCGSQTIQLAVPDAIDPELPFDSPGASVCTRCLEATPRGEVPESDPELDQISPYLPEDTETATTLVLALGLLDSIGLYRAEVETLFRRVENAGADPFLTFERLLDSPTVEFSFDGRRRRTQLQQLLE